MDLNNLLDGWEHEPGQISVRKVVGRDGRDKLQMRIDMGLIQMEMDGRPDGKRPHGKATCLEYHQERAAESEGVYVLTAEDCGELQQEGVQYYHRYISLFQLEDFAGVVRDTQRNLDLFDFVAEHAESTELVAAFEQYRAYVLMMRTRGEASLALESGNFALAEELVEAGKAEIEGVLADEHKASSPELEFLNLWLEDIREKRPVSKLEEMERELKDAIRDEAYERAAELRDAIQELKRRKA